MRLSTPRSEQGQTVERSYGWCDGEYYRRVHDRGDQTTQWYRADAASRDRLQDSEYDAGGEDDSPYADWIPCAEPRDEDE